MITVGELKDFSALVAKEWQEGKLPYMVHLCGGNEEELINIFKYVNVGDYIFASHRAHYHYLLAGGSKEKLLEYIHSGKSMHILDRELNFFTTGILSGNAAIAVGVAMALKRQGSKNKVWCFLGDGAEDEGHFYEAVRYVNGHNLSCIFIVEDNDRAVNTTVEDRWGKGDIKYETPCIYRYKYIATYPHMGEGSFVSFGVKL